MKQAKNYSIKASRCLSIAITLYTNTLAMLIAQLHTKPCDPWFWGYFGLFSVALFSGTLFFGEYRFFKRMEDN
ncbi:MAG: hypothetical protein QM737_15060 [Ferruginibacter sp.]